MRFARAKLLFGEDFEKLCSKRVLICGLGGVGGACFSALARTGINVCGIDKDIFDESNQNRQLHSEHLGRAKAEVFSEFYKLPCYQFEINRASMAEFFAAHTFDLVIDCIDDVKAKCDLAELCNELNMPFLSSAGAAKRLDPSKLRIANWDKTKMCALAKAVRTELKKRRFKGKFLMTYSEEEPKCQGLGSFMGVTASMGLMLASLAIKKLS